MTKSVHLISRSLFFPLLMTLGCSNAFEQASNKNTDAAYFEDAIKAIDAQNWDLALSKFNSLSTNYRSETTVIEAWAGAYAGKCGLNFIGYFGALNTATLTGSTLFKYLMNAWTGKLVDPASCTLAQRKMEEISTSPANRTQSENFFLAILGMVKVGTYLRQYADRNGVGNLGDGIAEINVCLNDPANLPNASLDEIITGVGLIKSNLSTLTSILQAGSITTSLNGLTTACTSSAGSCDKTDPNTITQPDRDFFRDLLATDPTNPTSSLGVGSCTNAVVATCC